MLFLSKLSAALAIDPRAKKIRFYAMNRADRSGILYDEQSFRAPCFTPAFYPELTAAAQSFLGQYTTVAGAPVTVVLPDSAIFTNLVVLPGMNRMAVKGAIQTALNSAYKNRDELKINDLCLAQSKQTTKISLCGVRQEILAATRAALAGVKLPVDGVTFGANAAANAAGELNPKLRGATYLLLDITPSDTRIVYVLRGCAVAFGALPFGYAVMQTGRVAAEDLLFDHSAAELAVLNTHERAKQKALTRSGGTAEGAPQEPGGETSGEDVPAADAAPEGAARKTARRLPKFMLRPTPDTEEGFLYENFRLFMKWALCSLQQNRDLTAIAAPEAVYVNLPEEFSSVFDRANAERAENGIDFRPLGADGAQEEILRHLELFGGTISAKSNKNNLF